MNKKPIIDDQDGPKDPEDAILERDEGEVVPGRHRSGWIWALVLLGTICLLVTCLLGVFALKLSGMQVGSIDIGAEAPEFTLMTYDQQLIDSSDLDGKVIVLHFWASWCEPCRSEADELQEVWQRYQAGGQVQFVGVSCEDTTEDALQYLDEFGITYPNGPDTGGTISKAYRITGVPETFIIDQQGLLADKWIGTLSSTDAITTVIDALLEQ